MPSVIFLMEKQHSHLYSSMGVARWLQSAEWAVEYWGHPGIGKLVAEQGFRFRPLYDIWGRFDERIRIPVARGLTWLTYPGLIAANILARRRVRKDLVPALEQFRRQIDDLLSITSPKIIIFDSFMLGYYPLFHRRGIRCVTLSGKPLATQDPCVPPYSSYQVPSSTAWGRWRVAASWGRVRTLSRCYQLARTVARAAGAYTYEDLLAQTSEVSSFPLSAERVNRWVHPDLHFRGIEEWVLWTPEIDFPRANSLPSNIRYVGPHVDTGRRMASADIGWNHGARYRIYVSVGTVRARWREHLPILKKVLKAFADDEDVSVLISTGSEELTAALGKTPSRIRSFDFLPQLSLLQSADLAITHGGSGTIRECILKEVPMLVYPNHHDQLGNSARVVYQRIGLRGRRDRDSPATIRAKALKVLGDENFRANLRRINSAARVNQHDLLMSVVGESVALR